MEHLIEEIRSYCAARGISPATFGSYAVRDGKFFERIERGGQCLPRTMEQVRAYMVANPVTSDESS